MEVSLKPRLPSWGVESTKEAQAPAMVTGSEEKAGARVGQDEANGRTTAPGGRLRTSECGTQTVLGSRHADKAGSHGLLSFIHSFNKMCSARTLCPARFSAPGTEEGQCS